MKILVCPGCGINTTRKKDHLCEECVAYNKNIIAYAEGKGSFFGFKEEK